MVVSLVRAHLLVRDTRAGLERAREQLEAQHGKTQAALEALGQVELDAYDGPLRRFAAAFGRLKNVNVGDLNVDSFAPELAAYEFEVADVDFGAVDALKTAVLSGGSGAVAGLISFAGVGAFATASTGTAIGTLGGAAATNATLAWLGGGSLAAGGYGMAGGMVVLGGLVALPVLAVGGLVLHRQGRKAITKAEADRLEADKTQKEMHLARTVARGIASRAEQLRLAVDRLVAVFTPRVAVLEYMLDRGDDYSTYDDRDREYIAVTVALAKTIRTVIDVPIFNDDGLVTEESATVVAAADAVAARYEEDEES